MATTSHTDGGTGISSSDAIPKSKKRPICRYYNTKTGCRAGKECRFLHPAEKAIEVDENPSAQHSSPSTSNPSMQQEKMNSPVLDSSKVVTRPTPLAQRRDPRSFQIGQIQRRFKPEELQRDRDSILGFEMTPSDPDFPYDIEALECELRVPALYPNDAKPTLSVKNKDIPRGFQINIERGFDSIAASNPNLTLLGLMNRLDRQLETILAGQIAETVKIVPNQGPSSKAVPKQQLPAQATEPVVGTRHNEEPKITDEDRIEARNKRQSDIRQLEARFSRMQSFAKSADGATFTLPLESTKRTTWPETLQPVRLAKITVPELYPISPLELHLDSESNHARAVEASFKSRSKAQPSFTIPQHLNYLCRNLEEMSVAVSETPDNQKQSSQLQEQERPFAADDLATSIDKSEYHDSHIQYIPRPPEWDTANDSDGSSEDESNESTGDTEGEHETTERGEGEPPSGEPSVSAPAERGILISFPRLELHGIELLELTSLNITVKCERCKDEMDIGKLRNSSEDSKSREESCKKCAIGFAVRFRADMIHTNSVRAGYLDLDGCTVVDMLPSNFIPTCSECSTAYPAPGVVAVRGDSAMAICRECHHRMSFRIQEVKFLQVSASAVKASAAPGRKKTRENLGITAGTELPRQGRCSHYRKSYRWFRFSCCQKVFPCDRCHDEQSDHPNEFANRMLCGFCSREQNYRPEDCAICHATLTGKAGRGFWEGGKGTRDPKKMSRKDPRKYKRRPGTKSKT